MKTKKNLFLLYSLIIYMQLSITNTYSQPIFSWAKSMGGAGGETGRSITTDASGNVYTTGRFQSTVDFDPGVGIFNLTTAGNSDIFISKLDSVGNFIWAKAMVGIGTNRGFSIATDTLGSVYTIGSFEGTVDFDPGAGTYNLTAVGNFDIFISKLDAAGNFVWAKSIGGTTSDEGNSIAIDSSGNLYITGYFSGTADFNPNVGIFNLTAVASTDIFVSKLDSAGNFIWAKAIGGTTLEIGNSIAIDNLGNIYTTGYFSGTVDFDPDTGIFNLTTAGGYDIFVSKIDTAGNFIWAKAMGGTNIDWSYSIAIDNLGNVYTTGYFNGIADFDPSAGIFNLVTVGDYDIFVSKLDSAGNFVWAKSMGGTNQDISFSIATDNLGNVYTTGLFQSTVDFDPGAGTFNLTAAGNTDIFVSKLDTAGNFVWAKSMGGTNQDYGSSIAIDNLGNIYTTGYFSGTANFDSFNLTAAGHIDIFVSKISICVPITSTDIITACNSYTWIDGNTYTISNNTATDTLVSLTGCDSIVTLNLTINTVDTSVSNTSPILTANAVGATYQWLDCDNNLSSIPNETNQSFTATFNGNYAVEVTQNGCTDTSACVAITNIGIIENSFSSQFTIYPNPNSGQFTVDLANTYADLKVVVRNTLGQEVLRRNYTSAQMIEINIESEVGIYFIEITSYQQKAVLKIIKE